MRQNAYFAAEVGDEAGIQLGRLRTNILFGPIQIVLPCLSPKFRVKAVPQNGNLAPTVPTGRDNNLITVQRVWFVLERERIPWGRGNFTSRCHGRRWSGWHEQGVQRILSEYL